MKAKPSVPLSTADLILLCHSLLAYCGQARRDKRLKADMLRLIAQVQRLYP